MLTFSVNPSYKKLITGDNAIKFRVPRTPQEQKWMSTVIFSAVEGRLNQDYSLGAYSGGCEKNETYKQYTTVPLINSEEREVGFSGVTEDVLNIVEEEITMLVDKVSEESCVDMFIDLHKQLLLEDGINLFKTIKLALNRRTKAVQRLREIFDLYKYSAEEVILQVIEKPKVLSEVERRLKKMAM